ncbi:MAG: hypothetical protein ACRERU_16475 [Methylococcales bacterium]
MLPGTRRTATLKNQTKRRVYAGLGLVMFSAVCLAVEGGASTAALTSPAGANPWSFNLNVYLWLPGVNGGFSAGPVNRSVDENFIDIVDASHRFPLGFNGRFETRYERFGLYLDGNYFDLDLKPKTGPLGLASVGLKSQMGILDYGFMVRLLGPRDLANWQGEEAGESFRLDLYAGGRTIWLDNTLTPQRLRSVSASKSFTSPVIGGRIFIDFSREWFVKIDGNVGGFGAQNVDFTGGILGTVGYRTSVFEVPIAIELGYKALRVDVSNKAIDTQATLNGPFLGATAYW